MFKTVDLYTKRYWQITMTFMLFVFVERFFHIPHAIWIVVTGSVLYSGFNPGTVLKRAYLRFYGTIIGVAAVTIVWHILHIDYRLATLFYILIVSWAVFCIALPYHLFVILATVFSDIAIQWGNPDNFSLEYYAIDRLTCTLIVFGICILLEYLWFGRSNMTYLNYQHLYDAAKQDIASLYYNVQQEKLTTGKILKKIQTVRGKLDQLSILVDNSRYEGAHSHAFTFEETRKNEKIVHTFRHIVVLHYLQSNDSDNPQLLLLKTQTQEAIDNL